MLTVTAGVIFAAIILTLLPELPRMFSFIPAEVAKNRMIIYSLIVIALMLLRPQGLFTFKRKGTA